MRRIFILTMFTMMTLVTNAQRQLFFYCPGATEVKITTSGGTVSNLTTTGTDTINDTDFQISGSGGGIPKIGWPKRSGSGER